MSHHFDTPTALEDPRINVCDLYLFEGTPGSTVMAMTVNPDAGISAPDTFREEGLYVFRFDLDEDAREDLSFKVSFGPVAHAAGEDHAHVQTFEVRRATGDDARRGAAGELIASGSTGEIKETEASIRVYAGLAPDLFAGNAAALGAFRKALFSEQRFDPTAFENPRNFFARRNVTAIVIELPTELIGSGLVHAWATTSLHGHAPEVQVSRWGLPLITNLFMPDPKMKEQFNRAQPSDDMTQFSPYIAGVIAQLAALSGATSPEDYAQRTTRRLCPVMLPYHLDTPAAFDFVSFNGRPLGDDVMDVILTLAAGTSLGDGVAPDKSRTRASFPYFGLPYSAQEQEGVTPARPRAEKK